MKHTCSLQFIACILIVGLFLQSCSGFANTPLNGIEEHYKQLDIQPILDKEFIAEGGHLVSFYQEQEKLKATVHLNYLDEKDKIYDEVNVVVEKGVELSSLAKLDRKMQQKRIQIRFAEEQKGKPKSVVVHKPWLVGGGKEVIAFYGTPGVGKSTLCNSIFQKAVFKSGVSVRTRMTTEKQEYQHEGKLYIDTPGLQDMQMLQQAAAEIKEALKRNKNYRVVFVATLGSGRIQYTDLVTINTIRSAISTPFEYGLVFNKVTKGVRKNIKQTGLNNYMILFNKRPCATVIINKDNEIEDEGNVYLESSNKSRKRLIQFLENLNINEPEPKDSIIFCGNPGVGKSTLCNSIFGRKIFESGVSIRTGMTTKKQEYLYEGKIYIDTPGLADSNTRTETGKQIEEALKKNGNYKIVFVITLKAGRLRPEDIDTIHTVCETIKIPFEYGLVINKISEGVRNQISQKGLSSYLESFKKIPYATVILSMDEEIEDEDNRYFEMNSQNRQSLINFLDQLRSNQIRSSDIERLETVDYKIRAFQMEQERRRIQEENRRIEEEHRRRVAELNARISRLRAEQDDGGCTLF
ncbi:GTP-binding protein HSR1-related [Candidatus Amoebophilus asiaticus 5a2]|uniref:GTP-binding protein HSR1-related n=1 Tax=Amoebophilus asiaticus (strain 5a2) TaxID=452471 RepID=B3EU78_AMOA5|nr:GTPase domain-containing protein [Candidatus Amoebophilus asiaticus]ACE05497.1 GTP-binding protein HSR1-related [Candidatus Amoebophilus asiaticus 5a2]